MGKIFISSALMLLIAASLSFADLEEDNEVRMIPVSKKMANAEHADEPAEEDLSVDLEDAPKSAAIDGPIPCADSELIKGLNEPDSLKPACFTITPDGEVSFNKSSQRMEKFEQKSSIVKLVCKSDDDPSSKKTYLFILNKNKISKVVAGSGLAVHMNYENGGCFDVTNVKQVLKPVQVDRTPANEKKQDN